MSLAVAIETMTMKRVILNLRLRNLLLYSSIDQVLQPVQIARSLSMDAEKRLAAWRGRFVGRNLGNGNRKHQVSIRFLPRRLFIQGVLMHALYLFSDLLK